MPNPCTSRTWVRWCRRDAGAGESARLWRRPPYVKQSPTKGFLTLGTIYGGPGTARAFNVDAREDT